MKHLLSKDLGAIFLLTTIYVIVVSFPNFHYSNHLNIIFLVASFLFSGYSLVALLRPEENYKQILNKPILILEFSTLITLIVSVLLRFSFLGIHLNYLVLVLSVIIMIISISAYIKRINYFNAHKTSAVISTSEKVDKKSTKPLPQENPSTKTVKKPIKEPKLTRSKRNIHLDLIVIAILSAFVVVSYVIKPLNYHIISYYLGLCYMVFLTGYTISYIIFPQKSELKLKIRLIISFGISFPITSIIGLPLYYSKYSFTPTSTLLPLAALTLLLCYIAYKRKTQAETN